MFGDRKELIKAALALANEIPAWQTKEVIDKSVQVLKDAVSTQVKATAKGGGSSVPSSSLGN